MIRRGTTKDIGAVAEIYEKIYELNSDIGWIQEIYPVRATAEKALMRGDLFVYEENGRVLASAVLNRVQMDVYADCDWKYKVPDEQVMVMHKLSVLPEAFGRGIGTRMAEFYEEYARTAGCTVLRIDTNEKNSSARRMYAKLGYIEAGVFPCVFNGIPDFRLVLLEKSIVR